MVEQEAFVLEEARVRHEVRVSPRRYCLSHQSVPADPHRLTQAPSLVPLPSAEVQRMIIY